MARKSDAAEEKDEFRTDPLHEVREKFKIAQEYWSDERKAALDDIRFRAGEQWLADDVSSRTKDKRPVLTVDKLSQYVRQIVNDGRQNRPSIDVRPVDGGADIATADIFKGVVKHIEDISNADTSYDTALDSAATCGFGYFQVKTDYIGDNTFDQEIYIRRIRDPLSVLIDPSAQEADASDIKFCFITQQMPKDEFEERYPNKLPQDWETNDKYSSWYGETVRIADYWRIEETEQTLYALQDGTILNQDDLDLAKANGFQLTIVDERKIPKKTVYHALVSGKEYLEEEKEWIGKYIPLMVVYGNEIDIEGKVSHTGIIRPGKDPQRLYNYSRSAFAERVALTPKAPWVAAEGQVEDYQDEWSTANSANHSVLRYRPTSLNGTPVPPPQRTSASDVPTGFAQDMTIAEHDIQAAIGMYNASLGAPSNERSGKAIFARQKEGDTGTFHYHDNLNRAIRHCGRVLVDLIPKIYDSKRITRVMGYDGKPGQANIDPGLPTASQKIGMEMVYNLGVGRYDVAISAGPSYNTLRQQAADSMVQMVQANPQLMQVIGDLMVKNMDWPGAQEISERLKMVLPPQIQQAMQAKEQSKGMPPEMQAIMQQFDQAMQQHQQQIQEAGQVIQGLQAEVTRLTEGNDIKEKEVAIKAADTEIKAYSAETQRMTAVSAAMTPEQVQQMVLQTLADLARPDSAYIAQNMEQEQMQNDYRDGPMQPEQAPMGNMPPQMPMNPSMEAPMGA